MPVDITDAAPLTRIGAAAEFSAEIVPVTAHELGQTWTPGCPVPLTGLCTMRLVHWGADGTARRGELVVATSESDALVAVVREIFEARFPIERMQPISAFAGDDLASMRANNSSAFNFRTVAGTHVLSEHAYGCAVDINPLVNP